MVSALNLLCSPEFVPQITGGALFPGAVTLKISVWHCPSSNKGLAPHLFTDVVSENQVSFIRQNPHVFGSCSILVFDKILSM